MSSPALSIVIPAYNEEARIGRALTETRAWLDGRRESAEILVVDDGSDDTTCAIVDQHAGRDARVKLLRLERNRGKGAAVRAGMLSAAGERVLFMDADLATPLEEFDLPQRALDGGADIAFGSRAVRGSRVTEHQPFLREYGGRAFNLLVQALVMPGFWDTQCGFKLFTREAAQTLFREVTIDGFAFDIEVLLLARGRYRAVEVPVRWRHVEKSKVSPLRDGARSAWDLLLLRLRVAARRWAGS
jgi:dolichyl-phosphate beta-glucosyltransferase